MQMETKWQKNNFKETHEYKDKQKHKKQITERHDNKKHRITLNTPKWLQGDTKLLQRDTKWL